MVQKSTTAMFASACAIALLLTSVADAQRGRRIRGAIARRAPLVRVQVGPYGGTSVRAPLVAVDPGGVHVGVHRRHTPLPQSVSPPSAAPTFQPTPATVKNSRPLPTAEQLAAMDDAMLLATLREMNDRLDARLTRFDTGSGWRKYLRIPEGALGVGSGGPSPAIQLDVLQQQLAHFHNVAANPEFASIARLPSFVATHMALAQLTDRFNGPRILSPGQNTTQPAEEKVDPRKEILPTPAPAVKPEGTLGERSILRRASRGR